VDLTTFEETSVCATADLVADPPGIVNAVALSFCAHLHGDVTHTLDPWRWPTSSWATSVWVLSEPMHVDTGHALRVQYHRRQVTISDGLSCEIVETSSDGRAS
jgi:hypothetical protein